jgi:hypothetical protein
VIGKAETLPLIGTDDTDRERDPEIGKTKKPTAEGGGATRVSLKPTPIWDPVGYPGRGWIAGIADIAGIARDRKTKTSPPD